MKTSSLRKILGIIVFVSVSGGLLYSRSIGLRKSVRPSSRSLFTTGAFTPESAQVEIATGDKIKNSNDRNSANTSSLLASANHSVTFQPSSRIRDEMERNERTLESRPAPLESEVRDLKDSARRLEAIDRLNQDADAYFNQPGSPGAWSVNQQDQNQVDYQAGGANVTKWYGDDGSGATGASRAAEGQLRAEEAQLAGGQVIDRWYHSNGAVQQVMHRYSDDRSYSVYYYDSGEVEATRNVQGSKEIFTKFDRSGRVIQKTIR